MEQQQGFADVNGTRLYYETAGSGDPLVLVHGFTLDTRMWDEQFETFAERYWVIRYDVRGFGRSAVPAGEGYAPEDDLRALMVDLEVEHAYVLGLSMGGGIAIDFALSCPEATDALIAVDALLGGYRWREFGASLTSVWSAARESGVEAAKDVWLGLPLFEPALEKATVASRLTQIVGDYSGWHFVNENPVRALAPPAVERLGDIATPTLIVVGERDVPDFRAMANALDEGVPGARKVVLPGVGHMSNMEDPEGFNEAVLSFLAGIRSA